MINQITKNYSSLSFAELKETYLGERRVSTHLLGILNLESFLKIYLQVKIYVIVFGWSQYLFLGCAINLMDMFSKLNKLLQPLKNMYTNSLFLLILATSWHMKPLVPWLGIRHVCPVVEVLSPNCWTTREFPKVFLSKHNVLARCNDIQCLDGLQPFWVSRLNKWKNYKA